MKAYNDQSAIEELADVLELVHSITDMHGSSVEELERVRVKKLEDRGGFKDKVFLIEVVHS